MKLERGTGPALGIHDRLLWACKQFQPVVEEEEELQRSDKVAHILRCLLSSLVWYISPRVQSLLKILKRTAKGGEGGSASCVQLVGAWVRWEAARLSQRKEEHQSSESARVKGNSLWFIARSHHFEKFWPSFLKRPVITVCSPSNRWGLGMLRKCYRKKSNKFDELNNARVLKGLIVRW